MRCHRAVSRLAVLPFAIALLLGSLAPAHAAISFVKNVGTRQVGNATGTSLVLTLAIVGFLTARTIALRRLPATTGAAGMIGETARVVEEFPGGAGRVHLYGEYWEARGPSEPQPGRLFLNLSNLAELAIQNDRPVMTLPVVFLCGRRRRQLTQRFGQRGRGRCPQEDIRPHQRTVVPWL